MSVFSYHLVKTSYLSSLYLKLFPPKSSKIQGLIYAETMSAMTLGTPIFSFSRILVRQSVLFAQWENEEALDNYLNQNSTGKKFAKGWHIRLKFLRQWGSISGFKIDKLNHSKPESISGTVVAVTLARMKFLQIPRFIKWGRPVEKLVRDHPGANLSLASIQFPNLVSTFSIWKSQKEMSGMVVGHNQLPNPKRHLNAMKERERKDFHFEFTTLRFQPIAEFGAWNGKSDFILEEEN